MVDEDDYYDDYDEDYDDDEYCDDDEYYEKGGKVGKSEKEQERVTVRIESTEASSACRKECIGILAGEISSLNSRAYTDIKDGVEISLKSYTPTLAEEKHTRIRANLICLWLF